MAIGSSSLASTFSAADLHLLQRLAEAVGIALDNKLLFEENQQVLQQIRRANSRLKQLDHTKDEFISMASHQLRTPLTTIKGYLSMVLEGDVGPVTKNERKMIQQAFDSAEQMVFLISDLLNVSRLQSGKFVIENKPTDLSKIVAEEIAQLKDTASNHKLKLTYNKPDNFPCLNLDENKIRQVVMNFLDNAIYYTPSGGSIEVLVQESPDTVSYTVTDTGLGVPKSEQHHLFTKFYRAGNAKKMRPDGTGLGLFMAKKVIAAQGGAIIFKSTEGKGSTFGFSFPKTSLEVKTA
jgi:signal transduction histidine kinase